MYAPTAAGHATKEAARQVAQGDISELVEAAKIWLDDNGWQEKAPTMVSGLETTAQAAGALAIHPQLKSHINYRSLGIFISKLYNDCCPESIITYPHDTPDIGMIGHRLKKKKTLIITGRVGEMAGMEAKGSIIINGDAGDNAGFSAYGPIIITGHAGRWAGRETKGPLIITGTTQERTAEYAQGPVIFTGSACENNGFRARGPIIALRPMEIDKAFCGTLITQEQYEKNVGLKAYVEQVLAVTKNDPLAIAATIGNGIKMADKIKLLARRKR